METLKVPLLADYRNQDILVKGVDKYSFEPIQFFQSICQYFDFHPMDKTRENPSPLEKIQAQKSVSDLEIARVIQMIENVKPNVCDLKVLKLALEKHFEKHPNFLPCESEIKVKNRWNSIVIYFGNKNNRFEYSILNHYFDLKKALNGIKYEEGIFTNMISSKDLVFGKVKFSNGQEHIGERAFNSVSNSIYMVKGTAQFPTGDKQEGEFDYDPKSKSVRLINGTLTFANGEIRNVKLNRITRDDVYHANMYSKATDKLLC
ncbi:MAG: hypothetical protein V4629_03555 [Pseudomonadota bacterium]